MPARRSPLLLIALLTLGVPAPAPALHEIHWALVGDPGNAPDDTGSGSVASWYRIAETEVTQSQYADFLAAVAAADPGGLWDPAMDNVIGIARSGAPGSYGYSVASGGHSLPINFVSFADALRYANWLHNGQPSGPQGPGTTEDGAYTITAAGLAENAIARNPGARIFLPSEDEWYKAAYYDPAGGAYFDYPVASDVETLCTTQNQLPNAANCDEAFPYSVVVGAYANARSSVGTFDQAGNVFEWTEGVIGGSTRVIRGGSWFSDPADQAASFRASSHPAQQTSTLGFRVAPEPDATASWLACIALLALLGRRRARGHALAGLALLAALGVGHRAEAGFGPGEFPLSTCTHYLVPAALAEEQPADQTIFARLCHPDSTPNATVADTLLVFVHGITYDHRYWDTADPSNGSSRYSAVAAAHARGFSTLAIDRLGAGQSSHPLSPDVNIDTNAHTVHEVIQAVRAGTIPDAGDGTFATVLLVGHSYGSWTTWFEATRYDDVDAVVLTGATHGLTEVNAPLNVAGNVYPAVLDPLYTESGLDPGYLTTQPDTRYVAFYAPGPVDPAVVAADEATKGTVTNAEIQNYQLILAEPLDIRVPVFLTVGSHDTLFCGPALGGADCSSEAALIAFESPFLGANVPSVDAYILPGGGHDMNPMWNAGLYFDAVLDWVESTVLGL